MKTSPLRQTCTLCGLEIGACEPHHDGPVCVRCWPAPCPAGTCEDEHDGCGARDCPHGEPLHYHHDGCPACDA